MELFVPQLRTPAATPQKQESLENIGLAKSSALPEFYFKYYNPTDVA